VTNLAERHFVTADREFFPDQRLEMLGGEFRQTPLRLTRILRNASRGRAQCRSSSHRYNGMRASQHGSRAGSNGNDADSIVAADCGEFIFVRHGHSCLPA
jgi:hypothetical protein